MDQPALAVAQGDRGAPQAAVGIAEHRFAAGLESRARRQSPLGCIIRVARSVRRMITSASPQANLAIAPGKARAKLSSTVPSGRRTRATPSSIGGQSEASPGPNCRPLPRPAANIPPNTSSTTKPTTASRRTIRHQRLPPQRRPRISSRPPRPNTPARTHPCTSNPAPGCAQSGHSTRPDSGRNTSAARTPLPATTQVTAIDSRPIVRSQLSRIRAASTAATKHAVHSIRTPAQGGSIPTSRSPSINITPDRSTGIPPSFNSPVVSSAAASRSG